MSRRRGWAGVPHRTLLGIATVAVLLAVFATGNVGQTYASWTDTADGTVLATRAGSITAVHTAAPGIGATFSAGLTTKTDAVTVTNTGTVTADFTTSTTLAATASSLQTAIAVTLWTTTTGGSCTTAVNPVTGPWGSAALNVTGTLDAGASVVVCVRTAISNLSAQTSGHTLTAALVTTFTRATWTSTTATAVPQAFVDAAPKAPISLTSAGTTTTTTTLTWADPAAPDDYGVTGYNVYQVNAQGVETLIAGPIASKSLNITGLTPSTAYTYVVRAIDGAGHLSTASVSHTLTTLTPNPSAPVLSATVTGTTANLSWTAPTDGVALIGYDIYRNGTLYRSVGAGPTTFADVGLAVGTYEYRIVAKADATRVSPPSNTAAVTVLPPTSMPCTPGTLTLTWVTAAGDNSGTFSVTVNGVTRPLIVPDRKNITVVLTKAELALAAGSTGVATVVVTHHRENREDVVLGAGSAVVAGNGTVTCG